MDDLLKKLQGILTDIETKIKELQNTINKMLDGLPWWVPDWLINEVHSAWNDLCTTLREEMQIYHDAIDQVGEPWTLRPIGDSWTTDVANKVSPQECKVQQGPLLSDDKFAGTAASAYRGHIVSQSKAIGNVMPNFTKPLQEGLDKVATAINKFVGALIAAAIPVVALIVAGIAACIGIISAPPGIGAIAVGVVIAAGAAYVGYTMMQGDCEDVQNSWNQAVSNWSGYDGEHWPKAAF